jgi:hypothetical protein
VGISEVTADEPLQRGAASVQIAATSVVTAVIVAPISGAHDRTGGDEHEACRRPSDFYRNFYRTG